MNKIKLFIVVNVDWAFLLHRLHIAVEAQKKGYDVTIVTFDTGKVDEIKKYGLKCISHPISRGGTNIFKEMKGFLFLLKLYLSEKPQIVHHVGLKLFLYGSLAALVSNISVVNALSGLGYLFTENNNGVLKSFLFSTINIFIKTKNVKYIFQNEDDKRVLQKYFSKITDNNCVLIKGSGVDLNDFSYHIEPNTAQIQVLFSGRILREKGVQEYIDAANTLRNRVEGKVEFILAGKLDDQNPTAFTEKEINDFLIPNYIIWIGDQTDIKKVIEKSNIVVLPSYREGLPKSLIEACAIGRPIITTNVPGCKEVVMDNYNGYLVPVRNSNLLAKRIFELVENKSLRIRMGINSRKLAESEFSLDYVVTEHLRLYEYLVNLR